jgi:hypothetical protein
MGRLATGGETESEAPLGPQRRVVSCLAESFPDREDSEAGGRQRRRAGTETGRRGGGRVGRQAGGRMGVGWVDGLVSGGGREQERVVEFDPRRRGGSRRGAPGGRAMRICGRMDGRA